MNMRKRMVLRIFFAGEIFIFIGTYIFGAQGLEAILVLHHENSMLKQNIEDVKKEIAAEQYNVHVWQTNMFYQEKLAREQLQMARGDEQVYFTS